MRRTSESSKIQRTIEKAQAEFDKVAMSLTGGEWRPGEPLPISIADVVYRGAVRAEAEAEDAEWTQGLFRFVVRHAMSELKDASADVQKFRDQVANALTVDVLEGCDYVFEAAARQQAWCAFLQYLREQGPVVASRVARAKEHYFASSPSRSTSQTSNLTRLYQTAAWAEVVEYCDVARV